MNAFGKIILLGEHAVVYGVPALAAGVAPGMRASCEPGEGEALQLHVPSWGLQVSTDDAAAEHALLLEALQVLREHLGARAHGVRVTVEAHMPPGGGLGSSAALGVVLVRTLWPEVTLEQLDAATARFESVFHGNASGLDAAVAARGGVLRFVRGQAPEALAIACDLQICVASSGPGASTKRMIERVAERRRAEPEDTARRLEAIGELVERGVRALREGNLPALGGCMNENHEHLRALGVSTPQLEQLVSVAQAHGALGAKLTGAGGGGAAIALVDGDPEPLLAAWRAAGFEARSARIGAV